MENKRSVFLRQLDLVAPKELSFPIALIGCGGIGSFTALGLTKMGCSNLTVIDYDRVEAHNVPSQLYAPSTMGAKVDALQNIITLLTGTTETTFVNQPFQEYIKSKDYKKFNVIICAVDSLLQRREIWSEIVNDEKYIDSLNLYIDARMGGEIMRFLTVNMKNEKEVIAYQEKLFSNVSPAKDKCTARAIAYNTLICGGMVTNIIKRYAKKESLKPEITFDIPSLSIMKGGE